MDIRKFKYELKNQFKNIKKMKIETRIAISFIEVMNNIFE